MRYGSRADEARGGRLARRRLALPLTALLAAVAVAVPTLALAGHETSNVADYTGCLKNGGNIANVAVGTAPRSPCSPGDTQLHFSGGDITDVATPSGGGLQGGAGNGAASLGLQQSYKLPQTCSNGAVTKWNGSAWACGSDDNTTYNGTNFATSGQSCPSGKFVTGIDANGALTCATPPSQSLDVRKVDASAPVPFAQGAVAEAACPTDYKLVGGGWGTTDSVTDGADVHDYNGGAETYDVGAGGTNPLGGTVYARAYCIKLN
jgi:hypothetical protein